MAEAGPLAYGRSGAGDGGPLPGVAVKLVVGAGVDDEDAALAAFEVADFDDGTLLGVDEVADLEVVGGDTQFGRAG